MRVLLLTTVIIIGSCFGDFDPLPETDDYIEILCLPEPYNSIEILPYHMHGWFCNYHPLARLIKEKHVTTIIEIGSWLGLSTTKMAKILPENGKIYAVDHWEGSKEQKENQKELLPTLYQQFLSNVIHLELTDKIIPIKMPSLQASEELKDVEPDLIYIDGSHEYEDVLNDLNAWYPYVANRKGKIICGDDWNLKTVQDAVIDFSRPHKLKIIVLNNNHFWMLV